MNFFSNILNYIFPEVKVHGNDLIEFSKIDKFNNVNTLIESDELIQDDVPELYKSNGVIDIGKTKNYYKKYIKQYYNYKSSDINIENPYTKFYILKETEIVLKY